MEEDPGKVSDHSESDVTPMDSDSSLASSPLLSQDESEMLDANEADEDNQEEAQEFIETFLRGVLKFKCDADELFDKCDFISAKTHYEFVYSRCEHVNLHPHKTIAECSQVCPFNVDRVQTELAAVLLDCGLKCNMLMGHKSAVHCFSQAVYLLQQPKFHAFTERQSFLFCKAFSCLIRTYLLFGELGKGVYDYWKYVEGIEECEAVEDILILKAMTAMEIGFAGISKTLFNLARKFFESALDILTKFAPFKHESIGVSSSALGKCYLEMKASFQPDENGSVLEKASHFLENGVKLLKEVHYHKEDMKFVVDATSNAIESQFERKIFDQDKNYFNDLLWLHQDMNRTRHDLSVAGELELLGIVAFNNENQMKACTYFEKALSLYQNAQSTNDTLCQIAKLLRYIPIACYNNRDFPRAAKGYKDALDFIETNDYKDAAKKAHRADCLAALAFTHSRLRDFEMTLHYYERAYEVKDILMREDRELIEVNIGNLYHVKAVKCDTTADTENADKYFNLAESCFNRALSYIWKSFPYVNYGYYLLCRGRYGEAVGMFHQGYLTGLTDLNTVEFDHTEEVILIADLKNELDNQESLRVPSTVISLYLKTLAQVKACNLMDAKSTVSMLTAEVQDCKYQSYHVEHYGVENMQALANALLGYSCFAVKDYRQALESFEKALEARAPKTYLTAERNIAQCIECLKREERETEDMVSEVSSLSDEEPTNYSTQAE